MDWVSPNVFFLRSLAVRFPKFTGGDADSDVCYFLSARFLTVYARLLTIY